MAKPKKPINLLTTVMIFFSLVCCKSSAARPLNGRLNPSDLAATDPAFNVVVAVEEKIRHGGSSTAGVASEKLDGHDRSAPCETEGTVKLGGIYGSLVINALPKGRTPASGPSRRNNDINI